MWHLLLYTEEPNTLTLGILYSNENQASLRRVGVLSGSSFLFYTFFLKQPAFNSLNFYLHSPRIHGFVQMSIPLNWIYKPNAFPNWIQIIASWNRQLFKSVFFKIIDFFFKNHSICGKGIEVLVFYHYASKISGALSWLMQPRVLHTQMCISIM